MAETRKYSRAGLDSSKLEALETQVKDLSNSELKTMYGKIKQQLETAYLQEIERNSGEKQVEILEKSRALDALISEMYDRGIVG